MGILPSLPLTLAAQVDGSSEVPWRESPKHGTASGPGEEGRVVSSNPLLLGNNTLLYRAGFQSQAAQT